MDEKKSIRNRLQREESVENSILEGDMLNEIGETDQVNGGQGKNVLSPCPRCGKLFTSDTILRHLNECGLVDKLGMKVPG